MFSDVFYYLYDFHCPVRCKSLSSKRLSKPWITNGLMIDINRKHALFRDYKHGVIDFNTYRCYRNILRYKIRQCRAHYIGTMFGENRNNSSKIFSNLNLLLTGRHSSNSEKPKLDDFADVNVGNELSLANHFNDYFSTIGSTLGDSLAGDDARALEYIWVTGQLAHFMFPTHSEEVIEVMSSLPNKSSAQDIVPTFIYKYLKNRISPVVSNLFNLSISTGVFPNSLKIARVFPIFKSGNRSHVTNYRPISILCILSKMFKKLMYRRLMAYLDRFALLNDNQFGFRKLRGTSDAILEFLNDVHGSFETKSQSVAVCLDFSKAFDTINHDVLLRKLDHMGVRGLARHWFASYLTGRYQQVGLGGASSELRLLSTGVPQGSVLGPLLFIIYINEMSGVCSELKCVHYADDTTVYFSHIDVNSLVLTMQTGLERLEAWFRSNRLVLNVSKTNGILSSNSVNNDNVPRIKIEDNYIIWLTLLGFLVLL